MIAFLYAYRLKGYREAGGDAAVGEAVDVPHQAVVAPATLLSRQRRWRLERR